MITAKKVEALIERAKKLKPEFPYIAVFADGSEETLSGAELIGRLSRVGSGIVEVKQVPGTKKEGQMLELLNGLTDIGESED